VLSISVPNQDHAQLAQETALLAHQPQTVLLAIMVITLLQVPAQPAQPPYTAVLVPQEPHALHAPTDHTPSPPLLEFALQLL